MSLKVPILNNLVANGSSKEDQNANENNNENANLNHDDTNNVNKVMTNSSSKNRNNSTSSNNNNFKNNTKNNNFLLKNDSSSWQQQQLKISKKGARSMYAPNQEKNYGPKATLKQVAEDYMQLVQDPLSQHLSWTKPPLYILNHHMIVYVEGSQYEHEIFKADDQIRQAMKPIGNNEKPSLRKFTKSISSPPTKNDDRNKIDLIICLGGDGTLLHASTLFQKSCPPVLSIHMGSLGFLCPFDFENYRNYVNGVIKGGVPLLLRNRLRCKVEKSLDQSDRSDDSINNNTSNVHVFNSSRFIDSSYLNEDEVMLCDQQEWLSLNEIVISRGPSPFLSNLDLYLNDYLITTVQGDGLIISTPTGSTAYAMAAGASMSHPSIPCIIIAPICPHSLSFRPITVPAGVELKIALSSETRNTAWYSIDGRNTSELKHGYHLSIKTSEYPLPSVCRSDQINDWFEGLATCLHWNQRQKQLPINSCYIQSRSLTPSVSQSQLHSSFSSSSSTSSLLKTAKINGNANQNIPVVNSSATINNNSTRSNSNDSGNEIEHQIDTLNNDLESSSIDLEDNNETNNSTINSRMVKSSSNLNQLGPVSFLIEDNL